MRYIYINNYRGFTDAIIPLSQVVFLVGENSTGKTSFLNILRFLSDPNFWAYPAFVISENEEFREFRDVVSAWSADRSFFEVGIAVTKQDKKGGWDLRFYVHTFREKNGAVVLSRYIQFSENRLTALVFDAKTKHKTSNLEKVFLSEDEAVAFIRTVISDERRNEGPFKVFPKGIPPNPPLAVAMSIARNMPTTNTFPKGILQAKIPYADDIIWIAPIRTRTKRFYGGTGSPYSPEGDHTPYLLRKTLRSRIKAKEFSEKLATFGKASGLFEAVGEHTFGRSAEAPFKIFVRIDGAELNIDSVGYGVCQALPLVVEFLATDRRRTFAVQQPEVHLHPRAQAALGDLIFEMSVSAKHSFFLETHSDYLIDRFRLAMSRYRSPPEAQVLFFERLEQGNVINVLRISEKGRYPDEQPRTFREFFIKEETNLLSM